jgi:hypothetical protein
MLLIGPPWRVERRLGLLKELHKAQKELYLKNKDCAGLFEVQEQLG